ncbi:MAG: M23 family metallopeptidase [Pseudomonadota bacterium]
MGALLLAVVPGVGGAGEYLFPVDCTLGRDCFIQQHVDRDPGPGIADYRCGTLTYDGHKGTDVRLRDRAAMRAGVDVLAVAAGTVQGTRDGMADISVGDPRAPSVKGRECGNGVRIRHDDGSSAQYCHLRKGSIRVGRGARVEAGQALGAIGLSGATEFPHLHLTLRNAAGAVIDPMDTRLQDHACDLPERATLWAEPIAYRPGGALTAGFADRVPEYRAIKEGTAASARLAPDAPGLVFWAHFFGVRKGDQLALHLTGPDGQTITQRASAMDRDRAQQFVAAGRRTRAPWPAGLYRGEARLLRAGVVLSTITAEVTIGE